MCNPLQIPKLTPEQQRRVDDCGRCDQPTLRSRLLEEAGITGAEVARRYDCAQSTVYAVINDKAIHRPSREALAQALDLPVEFLFPPAVPDPSIAKAKDEVVQNISGENQR